MANHVNIDKLRLAFLGVSHWHMVLFAPAIKSYGLNVVAVSDSDPAIAGAYAGEFKCKTYADPKTLMEQERPDFVFAFDVHADMAALCKTIISEGIAFSMEKPLGINAAEVREVKELAEKNGVFCSIPFIWRYSTLMREIKEKTSAEDFYNLSFNFICGPPSRYTDTSPWLLQNAKAGGGCMTNLGVHFMDMGYWLTESDDAEVLSAGYHYIN
ncbi:MAG: Gfo/Idh/MocA family oxidoreductase, partial [Peptococcaceae bacterium]|nr:Gfo/Idh/MocA family oxidoreductase [Peptococcaceae bacterium]